MSSVRRSLRALIALGAVLVALVGLVGGISALNSARAVDQMVDEIRPAAVAARGMHTEAITAGASLRAFALSGDSSEVETYRRSVTRMSELSTDLDRYISTHPNRTSLRDAAVAAFNAWVRDYATQRIATGGGPETFDEELYRQGQVLYQDSEDKLTALTGAIEQDYAAVRSQIHDRLRATVSLIVLAAVLGVLMLAVLGWWTFTSIERPLVALGRTIRRLRDGEYDVRAAVTGPVEVREVASAVNQFAEENGRARAMEERIQRELRQMDKTRNEFVSNVSHELRTPLTIISANLELLDDDMTDQLSPHQEAMLSVTRRNVTRLSELIEDLLTLNTAEQSGTPLDLVDFQAVVTEVVGDLGVAAANRGVNLVRQRLRQPVMVLGDANQLRRAVLNLVGNALKFSSEGGNVWVEINVDDNLVYLRILDNGMGIPAEDLEKVGSRFFRASNAVRSEVSGTGLGLRIVQTIIHNHHGALSLASEVGAGTTATIVIPLADPVVTAAEAGAEAGAETGAETGAATDAGEQTVPPAG